MVVGKMDNALLSCLAARVRSVIAGETNQDSFTRFPPVIAAVSGGPDSTAMLVALIEVRRRNSFELSVAHIAYGLREGESEEDLRFVRRMCIDFGLKLDVIELTDRDRAKLAKNGLQNAARDLRLKWFSKLAKRDKAVVALGHTRNDQVETFFMHLFRGAGLKGLAGMKEIDRGILFRPILTVSRSRIIHFLEKSGISYRRDSSNESPVYYRNRIRNLLLPEVAKLEPSFDRSISRAMAIIRRDDEFIETKAEQRLKSLLFSGPASCSYFFIKDLTGLERALLYRVIRKVAGATDSLGRELSSKAVDEIVRLVDTGREGARTHLRGRIEVIRSDGRLWFFPVEAFNEFSAELKIENRRVDFNGFRIEARIIDKALSCCPNMGRRCYLPIDSIDFPVYFRSVRKDDTVLSSSSGGGRVKKVSKILRKYSVPKVLRRLWPVLTDRRGVLWVAGLQASSLLDGFCQDGPVLELKMDLKMILSRAD